MSIFIEKGNDIKNVNFCLVHCAEVAGVINCDYSENNQYSGETFHLSYQNSSQFSF
jgi:hypothetical protein